MKYSPLILLTFLLLVSCEKNRPASDTLDPYSLEGRYCGQWPQSNFFQLEVIHSDTLNLSEKYFGNLKIVISADQLIIPLQPVSKLRYSPGGAPYTLTEPCEGTGSYDSPSQTISFDLHYPEQQYKTDGELILTRFNPLEGIYRSPELPNDQVIILKDDTSDSLCVEIQLEENEFGGGGMEIKVLLNQCMTKRYIWPDDSTLITVELTFPPMQVELEMIKWRFETDEWEEKLTYHFTGILQDT
jgi:hypothetical protein